jgi:dTMP kinase
MGYFITLEGGEGGGKSTQTELLAQALNTKGHAVIATREPGGTEIGKKIRELLLSGKNQHLDPVAELLLYAADRAQHVHELIRPALAANKIVISDRFQDSTTVYQGVARGLNPQWARFLAEIATGGLTPHLTFILDMDPELGLKRALQRLRSENSLEDRFEKEALEFHRKVRQGFLDLAQKEPQRFVVIKADRTTMEVHEEIFQVVLKKLKNSPLPLGEGRG